jgi:aspartate carbamoyltransferase catalytic subunit
MMIALYAIDDEGDGTGEHPTQALLDIFTIKSELGVLGSTDISQPMVVTLLGDLKNGRTVHSLVKLLGKFSNIKLVYVAPAVLAMPADIIEGLEALGVQQTSSLSLEEAIVCADVLYVTRIQKERYTYLHLLKDIITLK